MKFSEIELVEIRVWLWQEILVTEESLVAKVIHDALDAAEQCKGKPTAIIMKTVKGKGVSFMENQVGWHGKAPNEEQRAQALAELEG